MRLGTPELVILVVASLVWLVPIVAAVWVVRTLARIRQAQDELLRRVEALAQAVGRRTT